MNEVEREEFRHRLEFIAEHSPALREVANFVADFTREEQDIIFAYSKEGGNVEELLEKISKVREVVHELAIADGTETDEFMDIAITSILKDIILPHL